MNTRMISWVVIAFMALSVNAGAAVNSVVVSASKNQLVSTAANTVSLTWNVASTAGVNSTSVRVINPVDATVLTLKGGMISVSSPGPHVFPESVSFSAVEVNSWLQRGVSQIVVERTFTDVTGGGSQTASARLVLNRSQLQALRNPTTGGLVVQGLRLEFEGGHGLAIAAKESELQAKLTLVYSGTGLLEGRWLLAEPGSTEAKPLFRTLALVRQNLMQGQRTVLKSPLLPTVRGGKYLLRFCLKDSGVTTGLDYCSVREQTVQAAYQVQAGSLSRLLSIQILSPNQQRANALTAFSWQPISGASVYQIQIFSLLPTDENLPSAKTQSKIAAPKFVTGMVVDNSTTTTTLSELVQRRLQLGRGYLWRVTAHDPSGRLLASSEEMSFYYVKLP